VIEDRAQLHSTVVTSQLPVAHWHEAIGDATIASAVLDRLFGAGETALSSSASPCAGAKTTTAREIEERQVNRSGRFHRSCRPADVLGHAECLLRRSPPSRGVCRHAAMNERRDHHLAPAADTTPSRCSTRRSTRSRDCVPWEAGQRRRRSSPSHELDRRGGETAERCRCSSTRPGLLRGRRIADLLGVTGRVRGSATAGRANDDPTPVEDKP